MPLQLNNFHLQELLKVLSRALGACFIRALQSVIKGGNAGKSLHHVLKLFANPSLIQIRWKIHHWILDS
jgi:hypothetical protein